MTEIEFTRKIEYIIAMLKEKGYDPYEQLAHYVLLNGNPYYITSHGNARGVIGELDIKDIHEYLNEKCVNWSRWLKNDRLK